jgi:hypothetical protein
MEVAVLKQGVLRQRLPREKLTSGLPTSSHSRRAPCLNPDRQSDSLTLLEIAPRKFQPHSRRHQPKHVKGLTDEQIALMERESVSLEREFRIAEKSYGTDHLELVLTNGYLGKLLGNARVVRYLVEHHPDILSEFQKLSKSSGSSA